MTGDSSLVRRVIDLYYEDRFEEAKQSLASFDPVEEAVRLINRPTEKERATGDLLGLIAASLSIQFDEFGEAASVLERLLTAAEQGQMPQDFDTANLLVHLRYHFKCDCLKKGFDPETVFGPLLARVVEIAVRIDGRATETSLRIEKNLANS